MRAAQAGFDKRGRGRRELPAAGKIKAERMLGEPTLRVLQRKDGVLLLAPVRRACCLELLCGQDGPFSCTLLDPVKCPLDIFPSIPQDDGAAMGAAGGVLG